MSVCAAIAVPHPPIILPAVGKGQEKKIQATIDAYREASKFAASFEPESLVVLSPHSTLYADYFHISPGESGSGDFSSFMAPQVSIEVDYDTEFVRTLEATCKNSSISAGTLGGSGNGLDHGTMIPLVFLSEYLQDIKIVRIGLSGLSVAEHYALGQAIASTAKALHRKTVIIASGDLSHKLLSEGPYGFAPEGPEFDHEVTACLKNGDFLGLMNLNPTLCERAAECGHRSFIIMAGTFDRTRVESRLLSYEGPFGVGYAVAVFRAAGLDDSRDIGRQYADLSRKAAAARRDGEDEFVRLARLSLTTYIRTGKPAAVPDNLPAELTSKQAGAFVSLKKFGNLRGCIGTISPVCGSLAEEIMTNAISASTRDPRFPPVSASEIDDLTISVDVLEPAEKISSAAELDVKRYGVIVSSGGRRGLLLPDLEGVDSPEQQIAIARQKAGIASSTPVELYRFEVTRHR